MAYTYKTEGIILKRWDHGEQDKMVRLLTLERGKLTTRAISARKVQSKLAGHLEPFIESDLFIARSKSIDILAGSVIRRDNRHIRHSILHSAMASYVVEVVDRVLDDRQPDVAVYHHVRDFLEWFDTHDANLLVVYGMILKLFATVGYRSEFYRCHQCKDPVAAGNGNKFHFKLWNVECVNCATEDHTVQLSIESIKVLRFLLERTYDETARLHLAAGDWSAVHQFMRQLLLYNIERELKSEPVMHTLLLHTTSTNSQESGRRPAALAQT